MLPNDKVELLRRLEEEQERRILEKVVGRCRA